nr:hypothetical protein GCM10020092_074060 [Actinoplanes digitatis]
MAVAAMTATTPTGSAISHGRARTRGASGPKAAMANRGRAAKSSQYTCVGVTAPGPSVIPMTLLIITGMKAMTARMRAAR